MEEFVVRSIKSRNGERAVTLDGGKKVRIKVREGDEEPVADSKDVEFVLSGVLADDLNDEWRKGEDCYLVWTFYDLTDEEKEDANMLDWDMEEPDRTYCELWLGI